MYNQQFPMETTVQPKLMGNQVEMELNFCMHKVPERVKKLLSNLGWLERGTDPDTNEALFHKISAGMGGDFDPDLDACSWRWYEAMAYEFGKFIDIGMDA